ncbi:slipin family protein [Aeoliella sp.]|uniref:slipin family protein n=1 Tax=Aeoliella sp. TaxID=2795800 RepID=UPI003CCBF844
MFAQPGQELIIKDTHRALWYEDGKLARTLEAGKYAIPKQPWFGKGPKVEVVLVDMRERDLTIKGQEILTADKVAIRVSILVQFRVVDPQAAIHTVSDYQDRLYSDVQLAARRSLASMSLEEILTNRNRLSEDILQEVKEAATGYGVTIRRADVKDLVFPGNLQEIMNRVLAAERNSQAQLVEARTRAEVDQIEAAARADAHRTTAEAEAEARRLKAAADAEAAKTQAETELATFQARREIGDILAQNAALMRLEELETLRELGTNANARLYVDFDRPERREVSASVVE